MTVTEVLTKVTTLTTLTINIQVAQKVMLEAGGTTAVASAKRFLAIFEDTELRPFLHTLYPEVQLTNAELLAAPDIKDMKTKILPFKDYIRFAIPELKKYIPEETVEAVNNYYTEENPIYLIAVTAFVVVIATLHQAGDLE